MWKAAMIVPRERSANTITGKLNLILSMASVGFEALVYIRIARNGKSANEPEH